MARTKRVSDNTLRSVNAILALVLVVFFLAHALLGALWMGGLLSDDLAFLVWLGIILVAVHVIMCCLTSARQLGDEQFPPSRRKKRHLALKWATGVVLLACATIHIVLQDIPQVSIVIIASIALAALAWHACVCAKSLLKDLGARTSKKTLLVIAIVLACVIIECALVAL